MSIWIIERKHPTETEDGWQPVSQMAFRRREKADAYVRRNTNRFWVYRAVEYVRKNG